MEIKSKISAIGSIFSGAGTGYSLSKYIQVIGSRVRLKRLLDIIYYGAFTRKIELLPPEGPTEFTEKMWMSLNSEWQNIAKEMSWDVPHFAKLPLGPYIDKLELAAKQEITYGATSLFFGTFTAIGIAYTLYWNREYIKMGFKHTKRMLRKDPLIKKLIGPKDPLNDSKLPDYLDNMYALY